MISIMRACGLLRELSRENPPKRWRTKALCHFPSALCVHSVSEDEPPHRGHNVSERTWSQRWRRLYFAPSWHGPPLMDYLGLTSAVSCDESVQKHLGPHSSYWLAVISWKQTLVGVCCGKTSAQRLLLFSVWKVSFSSPLFSQEGRVGKLEWLNRKFLIALLKESESSQYIRFGISFNMDLPLLLVWL